jgi:3-dehydroquinate synthase
MDKKQYTFSSRSVDLYFDVDFSYLEKLVSKEKTVIITDKNIAALHPQKFEGWKTIVLEAGEQHKQQATVDHVVSELIKYKADRESWVIGVGGGVITDITGYAASVYMRGIKFAFVPTSILAMVDAAIGGKNGVDVGVYKNLVGTIRHPEFLLYDESFLNTLPEEEWINGFAEIIKHACIKDRKMFEDLESNSLQSYIDSNAKTMELVKRNAGIKYDVVSKDEFEKGERKLLNFGHTLGHAIENIYSLPHGSAISIGMDAASGISEKLTGLAFGERQKISSLLQKYHLPVHIDWEKEKVWDILVMDKKKAGENMNFILLNSIGDAVIRSIPLDRLKDLLNNF